MACFLLAVDETFIASFMLWDAPLPPGAYVRSAARSRASFKVFLTFVASLTFAHLLRAAMVRKTSTGALGFSATIRRKTFEPLSAMARKLLFFP